MNASAHSYPSAQAFDAALREADANADLTNAVASGTSWPTPLRQIVRLVGRGILSAARHVVHRQTRFNNALLTAVRAATDHREEVEELAATRADLAACQERVHLLAEQLRAQARTIDNVLEQVKRCLPGPLSQDAAQAIVQEERRAFDSLYAEFEDHFRGSTEIISERLRGYLPRFRAATLGSPSMPVLDVGCGRGEWLELLRQAGMTARGVDDNRIMIERCRAQGLDVTEADVIGHLRSLPDQSVGLVTGFHIIEHLPLPVLIRLFDESYRILKPGGAAMFETPNPANVHVGSNTFYLDPTHKNPLPHGLSAFLLGARGFANVEVITKNPYPAEMRVGGSPVAERFNDAFYGPQDYAVLGWKPA